MIDIEAKFDDLQDLPISEELLGASIDGNLHGAEFREVENLLSKNSALSGFIDHIENDFPISALDIFDDPYSQTEFYSNETFDSQNLDSLEIPSIAEDYLISATPSNSDFTLGLHEDLMTDNDNCHHANNPHCGDDLGINDSFHKSGVNDNFDI